MSINYNNKLYPALVNTKEGKQYGYINNKGIFKIPKQFKEAYEFNSANRAIVSINGKYGLIGLDGLFKVEPKYDSISQFKENRAIYTLNETIGVMNELGETINKKNYNFINDFNNGMAVVSSDEKLGESLYGYINCDGIEVIPTKYKQASDFNEGFTVVKIKDGEFDLIDRKGTVINTYKHNYVGGYGNGLMFFSEGFGEKYGYINVDGDIIVKAIYYSADGFKDEMAVVSVNEAYNGPSGVINTKGEYIYKPIYSNIVLMGEGKVALGKPLGSSELTLRSIYAIGNNTGNILTDFKYLEIGKYNKGLAYACDKEYTFFIDETGEKVENLPKVKGSGTLEIKNDLVYGFIDYYQIYLRKDGSIIYKPNSDIYLSDKYSVRRNKYKPNINFLIYYPEVIGIKNKKVKSEVNKKLKEMSSFTPYVEEGQTIEPITIDSVLEYSYLGDFTIIFFRKDLLVLDMSGYYYPLGAAHGMPNRKTPCINLVTGRIYELGDLFMGGVYYTGELNKIIKKMIETDPQYDYLFKDGFTGIKENQDFYVDDEYLYIYFPPYEIGPYSAGFVTFKIKLDDIKGMINKNGEFFKSFN